MDNNDALMEDLNCANSKTLQLQEQEAKTKAILE